jgi:hypothetical protein
VILDPQRHAKNVTQPASCLRHAGPSVDSDGNGGIRELEGLTMGEHFAPNRMHYNHE